MARAATTIDDARLLKEKALAKLRVLQSGQLEGSLLSRDEVKAQWSAAFASMRDRALGMGDSHPRAGPLPRHRRVPDVFHRPPDARDAPPDAAGR
ncbi:MAG: hypothetical protein WBY44_20275 [Bryobacteraceae bacterium]|jgi:hypothetical protein